jgi:hypothetical protein
MPSAVEITTPFLSIEEVAKRAGVSPPRAREIVRLAEGISERFGGNVGRSSGHRAAKKRPRVDRRAKK